MRVTQKVLHLKNLPSRSLFTQDLLDLYGDVAIGLVLEETNQIAGVFVGVSDTLSLKFWHSYFFLRNFRKNLTCNSNIDEKKVWLLARSQTII